MIVDRSFKAGIISRKEERSISRQTLTHIAVRHGQFSLYQRPVQPRALSFRALGIFSRCGILCSRGHSKLLLLFNRISIKHIL